MEKVYVAFETGFTWVGNFLANMLGGWDKWVQALIAFIVIDLIIGLLKSITTKKLSMSICLKGLNKIIMLLLCIAVAEVIETTTGLPIRTIVVCFYIATEGLAILDHLSEFIPIPKKLKELLTQLKARSENADWNEDKNAPYNKQPHIF